jgi:hypothetical protein
MEYHADRFTDYSLLWYDEKGKLVALMPASVTDGVVTSHGGLTYGGVICDADMKTVTMLELFSSLLEFLCRDGMMRLVYKPVPSIFHRYPAEEDLYALFRVGARLFRRDLSSAIYLPERLRYSENRRRGIKRAQRNGLAVGESHHFGEFFALADQVLQDRHNVRPVHTWQEMKSLAESFPENIDFFEVYREKLLTGVIMYVTDTVAHVQYMVSSDEGKEVGALDLLLDYLISERYAGKRFFSFGVSTENGGQYLNEGLTNQKEQFGGRAIVHDFYEVDLA